MDQFDQIQLQIARKIAEMEQQEDNFRAKNNQIERKIDSLNDAFYRLRQLLYEQSEMATHTAKKMPTDVSHEVSQYINEMDDTLLEAENTYQQRRSTLEDDQVKLERAYRHQRQHQEAELEKLYFERKRIAQETK